MCEIYVKADPILYESRSRSVRIRGVITSIRLENVFWDILAQMAAEEGVTTNHLIATLHGEIGAHRGEVSNFASFLRVTCLRYVSRRQQPCEQAIDAPSPRTAALPAARPAPRLVAVEPQGRTPPAA